MPFPLAGLLSAAWILAVPVEGPARSWLVAVMLEVTVPLGLAVLASRGAARDMTLGTLESIAVRGRGYRGRSATRALILSIVWACAVLPPAVAAAPAFTAPIVLASAGGSAVLAVSGMAVAALARSELAGAATAGSLWLASLFLGRSLSTALPAAVLQLMPYAFGVDRWMEVKLIQLAVAAGLLGVLLFNAESLARRAVAASGS